MNRTTNDPLKYKNYIAYLYANAKNTTAVHKIKSVYKFLRKYILVGKIFRYIRIIFIWIQTGAYFLLISTAIFILLPLVLVSVLGFCIYTMVMHKKNNKYFSSLIKKNKVCIIFKENENEITDICATSDIHIFVITSPFTQLTECVKMIDKQTFCISMSYFYSLKKHILDKNKSNVIYNHKEVIS